MAGKMIQYEHHGDNVWVQEDLKGKHREMCLCYSCEEFKPDDRDNNCIIANELYDTCMEYGGTSVRTECPHWNPKETS